MRYRKKDKESEREIELIERETKRKRERGAFLVKNLYSEKILTWKLIIKY